MEIRLPITKKPEYVLERYIFWFFWWENLRLVDLKYKKTLKDKNLDLLDTKSTIKVNNKTGGYFMDRIDIMLEEFHESRKAIKKDLSPRENILYIFDSLTEERQTRLLAYAEDVFYSQRHQDKVIEVPLLDIKLVD